MTMKDNIRFGNNKTLKERGDVHYDNYNAIDVPAIECIPNDYDGIMGVPCTKSAPSLVFMFSGTVVSNLTLPLG